MKLFLFNLIFFYCNACCCQKVEGDSSKGIFTITGHVTGRDTGLLVLRYYDYRENWVMDTTTLKNGDFEFFGAISQPTHATLKGNFNEINFRDANDVGIFIEPTRQKISLTENDYENIVMEGSKTQNEFQLLHSQIGAVKRKWKDLDDEYLIAKKDFFQEKDSSLQKKKKEKADKLFDALKPENREIQNVVISFVDQHPDSYVSAFMLGSPVNVIPLDSAKLLYNNLSGRIKNSRNGRFIANVIRKRELNTKGVTAPNFSLTDKSGQNSSLYDLKGKFVLLDFWASWCIPCRKSIPHLKELYNRYHQQGLEIITISIDKQKESWEKAVDDESIDNWYNVVADDVINRNYNNVSLPIPSEILINKAGKIVWNSNSGDTLDNVLSTVFNN